MPAARRLFVLLGAYEDLTERESGALRRGDIDYATGIERRKLRLAEAMAAARQTTVLSSDETALFTRRVRNLEAREKDNLAFLREESARVRSAIVTLRQAAQRSRQVRRGYGGATAANHPPVEVVLGRA